MQVNHIERHFNVPACTIIRAVLHVCRSCQMTEPCLHELQIDGVVKVHTLSELSNRFTTLKIKLQCAAEVRVTSHTRYGWLKFRTAWLRCSSRVSAAHAPMFSCAADLIPFSGRTPCSRQPARRPGRHPASLSRSDCVLCSPILHAA